MKNSKEYMRKWREENRETYKEYQRNYYVENKGKWKEYNSKDSFNCVYRILNTDGDVIRIGSTSNLRKRISNYMSEKVFKGWGIWKWFHVLKADKVEYIMVDSREKAFALECVLLKQETPLLNTNQVKTDYFDEYIESLGDVSDIEDLWEEWNISRYKNVYLNLL